MNRDEIEGLIHDLLATDNITLMDEAAATLRAQQERIDALEAENERHARDYDELRDSYDRLAATLTGEKP